MNPELWEVHVGEGANKVAKKMQKMHKDASPYAGTSISYLQYTSFWMFAFFRPAN